MVTDSPPDGAASDGGNIDICHQRPKMCYSDVNSKGAWSRIRRVVTGLFRFMKHDAKRSTRTEAPGGCDRMRRNGGEDRDWRGCGRSEAGSPGPQEKRQGRGRRTREETDSRGAPRNRQEGGCGEMVMTDKKPPAHNTKSIVNYIINRALKDGVPLTHLKLQKLLYFLNGYYIAVTGRPLIDRTFEAWDYGPVVPAIYHELKKYGGAPITTFVNDINFTDDGITSDPVPIPTDDEVLNEIFEFVWNNYGQYSALKLSAITHKEGTPWDKTRKRNPGIKDADIPFEEIQSYFKGLTKRKDQ